MAKEQGDKELGRGSNTSFGKMCKLTVLSFTNVSFAFLPATLF